MATDLKIEYFSCELFNALWREYDMHRMITPFKSYPGEEIPTDSEMNEDILKAVKCRQAMFYNSYRAKFFTEYCEFCDSTADFYTYLRKSFPHDLYENKPVVEKVFATAAFSTELCLYAYVYRGINFFDKCYLIWAMYFDSELKNQFYAAGGWYALNRMAQTYILCYNFLEEHTIKFASTYGSKYFIWPVYNTIAALEEFGCFLAEHFAPRLEEALSTKWVNYYLKNNHKPAPITALLAPGVIAQANMEGTENLLQFMKKVCDPSSSKVREYDLKRGFIRNPSRIAQLNPDDVLNIPDNQSQFSNTVKKSSENPVNDQKTQSGKGRPDRLKTEISSPSPSKEKSPTTYQSPVSTSFKDNVQNEVGGILSKLDINAVTPENIKISPNRHSLTIISPKSETRVTRKRRSGGKENSPSQISISQNFLKKVSPAKELASSLLEISSSVLKSETESAEVEETSESTSRKSQIHPKKKSSKISPDEDGEPSFTKVSLDQTDKCGLTETKVSFKDKPKENTTDLAIAYDVKDILRMMLVLGSPTGIRYVKSTLHNNQSGDVTAQSSSSRKKR